MSRVTERYWHIEKGANVPIRASRGLRDRAEAKKALPLINILKALHNMVEVMELQHSTQKIQNRTIQTLTHDIAYVAPGDNRHKGERYIPD